MARKERERKGGGGEKHHVLKIRQRRRRKRLMLPLIFKVTRYSTRSLGAITKAHLLFFLSAGNLSTKTGFKRGAKNSWDKKTALAYMYTDHRLAPDPVNKKGY